MARPLGVCVIGQSFGGEGYGTKASYHALAAAIDIRTNYAAISANTGLTVDQNDLLQMRNLAVNGSAVLQVNEGSSGYWVTNAGAAGSLLTSAVSAIGGYAIKPLVSIYNHLQQDSIQVTTEALADDVIEAIEDRLWPDWRAALNAGSPTSQPIWVEMHGHRFSGDEMAEYWLRDGMISLIERSTNVFRGSETYYLPMDATTHPTSDGYRWMGAQTGRRVAAWLQGAAELRGPQIASAAIVRNAVEVTFTIPAGTTMLRPTNPDFFGLFTSGDVRIPHGTASWSGRTLRLPFEGAPAKLRYPARSDRTLDINNVIRLANDAPLFTGEPGLVLESAGTITL